MTWTPDTPVSECVAVVVDPFNRRFGQEAEIKAHDWREYGDLFLRFGDGEVVVVKDGLMEKEPLPPEAIIFNRRDQEKVEAAKAHLPKVRDELKQLQRLTGQGDHQLEGRLSAKAEFVRVAEGGEPNPAAMF